jgi:hypothetical protein
MQILSPWRTNCTHSRNQHLLDPYCLTLCRLLYSFPKQQCQLQIKHVNPGLNIPTSTLELLRSASFCDYGLLLSKMYRRTTHRLESWLLHWGKRHRFVFCHVRGIRCLVGKHDAGQIPVLCMIWSTNLLIVLWVALSYFWRSIANDFQSGNTIFCTIRWFVVLAALLGGGELAARCSPGDCVSIYGSPSQFSSSSSGSDLSYSSEQEITPGFPSSSYTASGSNSLLLTPLKTPKDYSAIRHRKTYSPRE